MFGFFKRDRKQDEMNKALERKRIECNELRISKGLAPFETVDQLLADALERERMEINERRISRGLKPFGNLEEMYAGDMRDLTKKERDELLASYNKKNMNGKIER